MVPDPSSGAWPRIRYDYEHTDRPVDAICAEHGISAGTLRNRIRRWNWTQRRPPVPREGPPPSPALAPRFEPAAPLAPAATPPVLEASEAAPLAPTDPDTPPGLRLQGALSRILPAIEAIVARLAAGPLQAREMEQAARALAALTRTLRELNGLRAQEQGHGADDPPGTIEDFRAELMRKINAIVAERNERQAAEFRDP